MLSIKFYKEEKNCYNYRFNEEDDFDIWLLYNLMDDLVSKNYYDMLIDHLKDKDFSNISGNTSNIRLIDNEIIVSDIFDDEKRTLTIKEDVFMELVKKWRSLCEQEVPVITIAREGNDFTIEAGTE